MFARRTARRKAKLKALDSVRSASAMSTQALLSHRRGDATDRTLAVDRDRFAKVERKALSLSAKPGWSQRVREARLQGITKAIARDTSATKKHSRASTREKKEARRKAERELASWQRADDTYRLALGPREGSVIKREAARSRRTRKAGERRSRAAKTATPTPKGYAQTAHAWLASKALALAGGRGRRTRRRGNRRRRTRRRMRRRARSRRRRRS